MIVDENGVHSLESQDDFNRWMFTRLVSLQVIVMQEFGIKLELMEALHVSTQAKIDQKEAERREASGRT